MSPAERSLSSPAWNTYAACARDASAGSRLSVGRTIRLQTASIASLALATLGQPVAERAPIHLRVIGVDRVQRAHRPGHARAFAEAEQRVPEHRGREVQRRRERRAPQLRRRAAGCEHRDLEPALERDPVGSAESVEQLPVRRAAAQEHVLSVVGADPVARERVGGPAQPSTRLHQRHARAGARAVQRRRDPGEPAADHGDAAHAAARVSVAWPVGGRRLRLRAATHAFSQTGSEIRRSRTSFGSIAIRSRMPR